MVGEEGNCFDELLDEDPALLLGRWLPDPLEVEFAQHPGHLLEAAAELVGQDEILLHGLCSCSLTARMANVSSCSCSEK